MQHDRNSGPTAMSAPRVAGASEGALPGGNATVDEMSDASFPASDPPSTWTWEVRAPAGDPEEFEDL